MLVADSILKVARYLGPIIKLISAVASHRRLLILANVLISKLEIYDHFPIEVPLLELALKDSIHVLQDASAMKFPIFEFTFIIKSGL
jgi:hypothetical protein